jgi:hypothetical protein
VLVGRWLGGWLMLMESNFIRRDESMMHTIADGYELN